MTRATAIIYSSLRFMRSLEANVLTPDIFHMNPKNSDTKWFHNLVRYDISNNSPLILLSGLDSAIISE